jgi:hypothetical protein
MEISWWIHFAVCGFVDVIWMSFSGDEIWQDETNRFQFRLTRGCDNWHRLVTFKLFRDDDKIQSHR